MLRSQAVQLYGPQQLEESPVLVTIADPRLRQRRHKDNIIRLQRSIKAHCILGGSVTVPGSLILSDDETAQAITALPELLQEGLLVPDLRVGMASYKDFVFASSVNSQRTPNDRLATATFLDEYTQRAITYDPLGVSGAFTRNVLRMLLLEKLRGGVQLSWEKLRQFADEWLEKSVIGTKELEACKETITHGRMRFLTLVGLIYHLVGAATTGSSPAFPEQMNTALSDLVTAINKREISAEGLLSRCQSSAAARETRQICELLAAEPAAHIDPGIQATPHVAVGEFALVELLDAFSIRADVLDSLSPQEVIEMSRSQEARHAREKIHRIHQQVIKDNSGARGSNPELIDLISALGDFRKRMQGAIRDESARTRRVSTVTNRIGWGSVAVGVATVPLTGGLSLALSLGGLLLSLGGASLDSWNRIHSKPMLALLERMQQKQLRGGALLLLDERR